MYLTSFNIIHKIYIFKLMINYPPKTAINTFYNKNIQMNNTNPYFLSVWFLRVFFYVFITQQTYNACSRVSVMRGQVVTPQGLGIVGIRVSVDRDSRFGFTLTRQGGW